MPRRPGSQDGERLKLAAYRAPSGQRGRPAHGSARVVVDFVGNVGEKRPEGGRRPASGDMMQEQCVERARKVTKTQQGS